MHYAFQLNTSKLFFFSKHFWNVILRLHEKNKSIGNNKKGYNDIFMLEVCNGTGILWDQKHDKSKQFLLSCRWVQAVRYKACRTNKSQVY